MDDKKETPKSTPRRTLGIRRFKTKSASSLPNLSKCYIELLSSPSPHTSIIVSEAQSENTGTTLNSTPINRKRLSFELHQNETANQNKLAKKLNLIQSPIDANSTNSIDMVNTSKKTNESISDLIDDIKRLEKTIEILERHECEKQKLTIVIEKWRSGALRALQSIQSKLEPKQEYETILNHLKIPQDLFDLSLIETE